MFSYVIEITYIGMRGGYYHSEVFIMRVQSQVLAESGQPMQVKPGMMKSLVFNGDQKISLDDRPIPKPGPGEAVIEVTLTTICGTDVHIVKGEYPVKRGLTLGHEAVGRIHELGSGVSGYEIGERVLVGAITPCGQCNYCLGGDLSQCGGIMGGWRLGNTIDGVQAQYALIPYAQANMAKIPDELTDEQVILLADIASTGFSASESAQVRIGDSVAIFAEGPIGLCATAGARLRGAGQMFAVDSNSVRLEQALRMGAHHAIDISQKDPVEEILLLTGRRGVDVAIEALGRQETFENALRVLRPGGTLSSLGVYSGKLVIPLEPFAAGLGDHKIVTTLCPGGKERMRRLMGLVLHHRIDLTPLLTHKFTFDKITEAYALFSKQQDGVLKVAIKVAC
jgi:threonine dehydrogenase-like Zn-dependent dehydrogenase